MVKQSCRIIGFFSVILFLQFGCAAVQNQDLKASTIVVEEVVKASRSWNGELLPHYLQSQPEITILRISIPAGARLETHHHPVINAGLLIKGELMVMTKDGKTLRLYPGDPVVEVVNTLHYGINEGKVPAEIIVFYAGVMDMPITVIEQ